MPSGARKRKASKKKVKNGDNNNNSSSGNNSSTTHSQASEDRRSFDDRESDDGEVERDEESREALDYEEGGVTNGKGLSEEIKENLEKSGSGIVDVVVEETPTVILSGEDNQVPVVEEKPAVAELEESKTVDINSVFESHVIPNQDSIDVESASVELVKDIVSLSQEINVGFGNSVTSDLVESVLIKKADLALPISDEKEQFSSLSEDLESKEVESNIVSMDEVKSSSGLDAVKTSEMCNAPAVTTTQVVEFSTNNETNQRSDKEAGATSEVDNVKAISSQKSSMDQTSRGINSLPVQRTSVLGCCGLFELFSGANK